MSRNTNSYKKTAKIHTEIVKILKDFINLDLAFKTIDLIRLRYGNEINRKNTFKKCRQLDYSHIFHALFNFAFLTQKLI